MHDAEKPILFSSVLVTERLYQSHLGQLDPPWTTLTAQLLGEEMSCNRRSFKIMFSASIAAAIRRAFSKTLPLINNNSFQHVSGCMHEDRVTTVHANIVQYH